MKTVNRSIIGRLCALALLGFGLTPSAWSENIFQADLNSLGGSARLNFGRIYLRAEGNQVDFVAVIFPASPMLLSDLNPVIRVPGESLSFVLGEASRSWLPGTIADRNPFLPAEPWLPHSYDEAGNPLYVDSAVIRLTDIYTGQFTMPAGFADELLAGLGFIEFNPSLGGIINVMTVPEPALGTLLLLGGIGWLRRQK